jgi:uncharacterized protein (DUF1697 family)
VCCDGLVGSYVAFLGGINVGGHRVTMERLRVEFEALGVTEVSTFIASGNVVFDAGTARSELEPAIEAHLAARLGFPAPTFVRTVGEVVEAATLAPFGEVSAPDTHFVAFLRKTPTKAATRTVTALSNERDRFEVHGKELHWLIHGSFMESSVKAATLAKALDQQSTTRNTTSLRKLAARLLPG